MSEIIVSKQDLQRIDQIANKPPQALLIVADYELDGKNVAKKIAKNSDIFHLKPLPDKQTISVEQIRELIIKLRTYAINRRTIIIDSADLMTESSQNALLKILEEPNKNTNFILIVANQKSLLDTIKSRCQTLTLHKTSLVEDRKLLEKYNLDPSTNQQILFLAAGRPLLIQQLARNPKKFAEYRQLATDAKHILVSPRQYSALKSLAKYFTDRQKALLLTDIIINMIRFQALSHGMNHQFEEQLSRTITVANALRSNANIKLSLTQLVL